MTLERLAEIRAITEEAGAEAQRKGDNGILLDATRDLFAMVERLRAALAAEREACAKVAEAYELEDVGEDIAAAIRAQETP